MLGGVQVHLSKTRQALQGGFQDGSDPQIICPVAPRWSERGGIFEERRCNYNHIQPPGVHVFFKMTPAAGHPRCPVGGYSLA